MAIITMKLVAKFTKRLILDLIGGDLVLMEKLQDQIVFYVKTKMLLLDGLVFQELTHKERVDMFLQGGIDQTKLMFK